VSSQAHLNKVVRQLNERPRKALGIETPAERLMQVVRRPVETTSESGPEARRDTHTRRVEVVRTPVIQVPS
jgi:hypothetical protein